jgi:radical SAM protein with 4Fe4S-binding SPASM domain
MEWQTEVRELYEKIVAQIPDTFRSMVQKLLHDTAEKKCLERNASYVNEADLITALFDITPEPFQAESIKNLIALGIDVQRYTKLKEIKEQYGLSWEQFKEVFHPGNYWFTMYLTDQCNQKCLHCAVNLKQKRPELSTDQWIQIVENLETSLQKQGRRGIYIWFGGEPTCRKDIRKLIKYCGERDYFHSISTNGILFDEDFAKYCADNGMQHVFVSLDSADPEKAGKIRGVPRTFEYAKKAIDNALKYGLFVIGNVTVMKYNINELEEIEAMFEGWGVTPYFRAIIKQEQAAVNWDEIGLSHEDYKRFYDFKYQRVIDAIRKGEGATLPIYSIFDMVPFMEQPLNDAELTALEWGVGCQACRMISGIDIDGQVFPCDYPSKLTLGNVLQQSFTDVMDSQLFKDIRDRKRTGKCASCHHLPLCGGGCRVHAECESGDFFASFSYCWHENDHKHDLPVNLG